MAEVQPKVCFFFFWIVLLCKSGRRPKRREPSPSLEASPKQSAALHICHDSSVLAAFPWEVETLCPQAMFPLLTLGYKTSPCLASHVANITEDLWDRHGRSESIRAGPLVTQRDKPTRYRVVFPLRLFQVRRREFRRTTTKIHTLLVRFHTKIHTLLVRFHTYVSVQVNKTCPKK